MYKLCVFFALFACASAGIIRLDDGIGLGGLGGYGSLGGIALAPKVALAAPTAIALKAGATSYQNSNLLSLHPTAVVTKAVAAPLAAPLSFGSPAVGVVGVDHVGLGGIGLGGLGYGGLGLGGLSLGLGH